MKLAIIHNHPIHYKHLLFQELTRFGADIEVLFLADRSDLRHEKIALSQDLYRFRIGYEGAYESAPTLTKHFFTWRCVSEMRPDIMIISGYYAIECWTAWLWARLHRRPIVMWFESNEFDHPRRWYKELLKMVFVRGLDGAHVYGISNKAYLVKLGLPPDRIVLKRAVVDVERFRSGVRKRSYSDGGIRRMIYVGRLAEEKNLTFLLRALAKANARLPNSSLFLTIAGTGPLEVQLRQQARDLGIADRVEFRGYCQQDVLPSLYRQADCMILPSVREPWGLVSLEAMLCGLPVLISTQCGCAGDVVTPDSGWAFSPFLEDELVNLLVRLADVSPERLAQMGDCGRKMALEYSATLSAERILRSLAALKPEPSPGEQVALGVNE